METVNKSSNAVKCHLKVRAGPSGIHFFNRSTGINVLVDEITPPTSMWSAAPRQVSVALTNACDLKCPHCYAPKMPAMLSFDKLTNWLDELDASGCIGVGFGGGEPTLYPRLLEICSYAARETNLAITMTTHAHRLSDQLLNELRGHLHFVRVSMDGVGSTYESIRCRSFDTLIARITALKRIVHFGINFVVNSKTIGDLDTAVHLAEDLGASEQK
jgi:MoaA/NifB/PqqE/SkfB family radical SAM enzyme